jgi:hypothetical protein
MNALVGKSRKTLLALGLLAFACRFVIPPGYMPASLADGGPIVLCPVGMPADFGSNEPRHHDTGHDHDDGAMAWEHCPLGTLFSSVALSNDFHLTIAAAANDPAPITESFAFVSSTTTVFRARAPPVLDARI